MVERTKVLAMSLIGMLALGGCADSRNAGTNVMGNTNWLRECSADADCSDDLSCRCGVCTRECETSADCDGLDDAVCDSDSAALSMVCGAVAPSVCLPECSRPGDCGAGYDCVDARCLPAPAETDDVELPANVELGSQACGRGGAYASVNVQPDAECTVPTEGGTALAIGLYDISTGFNGDSDNCDAPYILNLLVHSCLSGEGDTLQIHSAEVRLMDIARSTIFFDRLETPLPNPFLVTTNGSISPMEGSDPSLAIAVIEAIPKAYARQLDNFVGDKILAEIQIYGTTVGDADIEIRKLVYTIDVCDGCLTIDGCTLPQEVSLDEVYGEDACRDNASADGRICIDYACVQ